MKITSKERTGEGQTICKGCFDKNSHLSKIQQSISSLHWDCMLYDVSVDGNPVGILCSDCIQELAKKLMGKENNNA